MDRELDGVPDTHRSRSFEIYVACSAVSFFLSYVLTYVYSFYYGKMTFDSQFHPGSDFPGSYVDPAIHDPEKYNLGVHFFGDFWSTLLRSGKSSPYLDIQDLGSSSYPPFAHLFFRPLTLLPYPLALTFFILGSVVIVALPFHLSLKNQSKGIQVSGITIGLLLSYPFLFALDRGNNITFAVGASLFALLAYQRKKFTLAAFLFALAAAIKVYPILFLFVFSNRKEWRHAFKGLLCFGFLSTLSLLSFSGGVHRNLSQFLTNLSSVAGSPSQIHLNHSISGFASTLWSGTTSSSTGLIGWFQDLDSSRSMVIFLTVAVLVAFCRNMSNSPHLLPEIVTLACVLQTLFVSLTYGYTLLIYLTVVLAILLTARSDRWSLTYLVLIAILFSSKGIPLGEAPRQVLNYVNPALQMALFALSSLSLGLHTWRSRSTHLLNKAADLASGQNP